MTSITDLVKETIQTLAPDAIIDKPVDAKNIYFVLDTSGSTGSGYKGNITVLDKEIICLKNYILENINNDFYLYSFESDSHYHGALTVGNGIVKNIPKNFTSGGTNTLEPLNEILSNVKTENNKIIIITDGQTCNNQNELKHTTNQLKAKNYEIEIIVVSMTDINMETISENDENRLAGMDLIKYVGNSIDRLHIFNRFHNDIPFDAINNSTINKNYISFMKIMVPCFIPEFIKTLMDKLSCAQNVDYSMCKIMLCEIGKLFSILFHEFPTNNPLLITVSETVSSLKDIGSEFTKDSVINIIKYGFECSKSNKPIILTNFQNHVKESSVKRGEFKDALNLLRLHGTTLGAKQKISIPSYNYPYCLIDNGDIVEVKKSLFSYPNSITNFGNVMFPYNPEPEMYQAIRIGLRKMCEMMGHKDAQHSPSVPFYVLNMMSLMYLSGISLATEHMKQLQKFAIIQTSIEVMIDKHNYDGDGCYTHWKNGNTIKLHYSSAKTHISLYTDRTINPLNLPETLWWAVMMSMLGLFDEQKAIYKLALQEMRCNTQELFLAYFKRNYAHKVNGNFILETFQHIKTSLFTLDEFLPEDQLFKLEDHSNNSAKTSCCKTQTVYSLHEIENYVLQKGCVWCHFIPTMDNFTRIVSDKNPHKFLQDLTANKMRIRFNYDSKNNKHYSPMQTVVEIPIFKINLIGVNGCGKLQAVNFMKAYFESKNYQYLVMDSSTKKKDFTKFMKNECAEKIIIVDEINKTFDDVDFSKFKSINFYPNLNIGNLKKFVEYEKWALNNVIDENVNGFAECVEMHNKEASKIATMLNVKRTYVPENLTKERFKELFAPTVETYKTYLTEHYDLEKVMLAFLEKNIKFV